MSTQLTTDLLTQLGLADTDSVLVTDEEKARMVRDIKLVSILLAQVAEKHDTGDTIFILDTILGSVKYLSGLSRAQLEEMSPTNHVATQPTALGGGKEATHSGPVADNSTYLKGLADQLRSVTADRDQLERDVASLRRTINSGLAVLGITPDLSTVPTEDEFVNVAQNALDSAAASAASPDPSKWVAIDEIGKPGTPGEPFVRIADIGRRNTPGEHFTTWQNVLNNFVARTDIGRAGTPGENLVDRTRIPAPVDPNTYVLKTDIGPEPSKPYIAKAAVRQPVDPNLYVLLADIGKAGTNGANLVDRTTVPAQIDPSALEQLIGELKGAVTHKSGLRGLVSSDSVDVPKFDAAVEGLERLIPPAPTQRMPRPGPRQP